MKNIIKKQGSNILLFIFFIGVILIVSTAKKSYAITTTGINRGGKVNTDFTTNYSTNLVNYIADAGQYERYANNFIVPKSLKTDGGKVLYLMSKNLDIPGSGQTFKIITETPSNPTNITDKGLIYIISHGYNETNKVKTVFTNSTYKTSYGELTDAAKQQYVTQIAIWLYINKNKSNFNDYCVKEERTDLCNFYDTSEPGSSDVSYNTIKNVITTQANKIDYKWLNYILKLEEEAEAYKEKAAETPKLDTLDVDFILSSDKTQVTSNLITPTSNKNNDNFMYYSIEIKDDKHYGVYLVDKNNKKITNLNNMSGSFKVIIPIEEDITKMDLTQVEIKIYGIYTYDEGYSYRVTSSTGEDVNKHPKYSSALLGYVPTNTIGVSFKARNFTDIKKVDSTNNKPLAGATLQIIDKNDTTKVHEWVSEEEPYSIFLEDGEYKLCETVAPENYEKSTECIEFTIKADQNIQVITMANSPMIVPNTGLNGSKTFIIIGGILLLIGGGILLIFKKAKEA